MSIDNDVPWSGPEPEDVEPWAKDEPPSRPPNILPPSKREPYFRWIGGALMPATPQCPKCGGEVEYRRRDDACYCRRCDEAFYHRSIADVLHAAGLWFL